MWVQSLSWEDPLEKEMATHSSILAWRIPWTEEPGKLQSMGSQRVGHNLVTKQQGNFAYWLHWIDKSTNVCCGERAPPVAKVMRKEARHTQRGDRASGVPLEILEHLPPKPESAYFLLCALTYTSDFMGGCPPLPHSEKRVSLQLQLIISGCDSVSTYKLLWKSSSLPE